MIRTVAGLLAGLAVLAATPATPTSVGNGPAPVLRQPVECVPPRGDRAAADQAVTERLRLAEVHTLATGRGQLVAVIDTGVAPHPRLAGRVVGGGDFLGEGDGLEDCDGHGTAVAGILAAAPGPDGVVGMAPGARVLAIRQFSGVLSGSGRAGDPDTLAAAIVSAVRAGATVINISGAACVTPEQARTAGRELASALRFAAGSDVVVVAAAGNVGVGGCDRPGVVPLPAWYDTEVLTVGAVEQAHRPAAFSLPGPWVDVAAPGVGLRSLAVGGGTTSAGVEGTSFAAAWVAGLAALVRERFPRLTAEQVVDRIVATARPMVGREQEVGHGVIDPLAALTAAPTVLTPAGATPRARLAGTDPVDAPPGPPRWPALAVVLLLAVAGVAAARLRNHPGRAPVVDTVPPRPPDRVLTVDDVHHVHRVRQVQRGPGR